MTTPPKATDPLAPSKAKAWWALLLPQLPAIISMGLQFAGSIPAPYGAIFAGVLSLLGVLTGTIVHQAKYLPPNTVIAPEPSVSPGAGSWPTPPPA